MRARFLGVVVVSLAVAASLLGACGGGDKRVAVDDWVDDVCAAALDFDRASDKAGETFNTADTSDTRKSKAAFKRSVDDLKKAQKSFRSEFDKLGQPDIDGGDKVVDAFHAQFKENDKLTNDLARDVAGIDDDDNFEDAFFDLVLDYETPQFRPKLEKLVDGHEEVQHVIDGFDDDSDCAAVIFQGDSSSDIGDEPTAAPSRTTVATRTSTPVAANTSNEKWVAGICKSFGDWVQDVQDASEDFQNEVDKAKDAPAAKKVLVDFMKAGQTRTKTLQTQVKALKAPDVKDGAAIHKVFVDASGELVKVFDGLVTDAQNLKTTSLAQIQRDASDMADGIVDAFDEAASTFDQLDKYDAPELDRFFESRPECAGG